MFLDPSFFSGFLPLVLILICGVWLSFKTRFFQIKGLFKSFSLLFSSIKSNHCSKSDFTSFKAAMTSLASTVGTGNIIGVSSAISLGGAGAVFWMILSAFFGMLIKYAEITLGVKYKEKNVGGPMYYIKNALPRKLKFLSVLFSLSLIFAVFSSGNLTQVNSFVSSFEADNKVNFIIGTVFAFFTFLSLKGGIKSIGKICEKLTPTMSLIYVFVCLFVIFKNLDFLPFCFKMIIKGAFNPSAVTGGVVGQIAKTAFVGASRGVFSNEAGLGTAAIAHSTADDADKNTQGLFGIFEVFCDTILICTLTALTILASRVNITYGASNPFLLIKSALCTAFSKNATPLLRLMLMFFSFSSVIGWALYGKASLNFLKIKDEKNIFIKLYSLFCILAAVLRADIVWEISAFANAILLIINIPVIIYLSDDVERKKDDTRKNRKVKNKACLK